MSLPGRARIRCPADGGTEPGEPAPRVPDPCRCPLRLGGACIRSLRGARPATSAWARDWSSSARRLASYGACSSS
jgi:hypothetical protein